MKKIITLSLVVGLMVSLPFSASAIECPSGAPDVPFSTAYNGVWRGTLPAECVNKKASTKKRTSTLKICVRDNKDGSNRDFTGSVRNNVSLRVLQEDAKVRPIGRRLNIQCGVPLENDSPAESAFLELRGKKKFQNRTANMAIDVADEKDAAVANPGDLVATMGNCVSVVYKFVKAHPSCP